jgi:ABC-type Mn2+/Zn2+ transport system ATPase subunit
MQDYFETPIGKLSGGMQQKVLIAQALSKRPEVFLLDEQFANLDVNAQNELMQVFFRLKQEGTTILMVSHFLRIPDWCDSVVLIDQGQIKLCAPPGIAREHRFIASYLALIELSTQMQGRASIND